MDGITVEIIQSRRGAPTARAAKNGRTVMIHSLYDPRQEARRQIAAANIEPGCRVIVCGGGLGYLQEALSASTAADGGGRVPLLVLEPVPELHRAFKTRQARGGGILAASNVHCGTVASLIDAAGRFLDGTSPSLVRVLVNPGYRRLAPGVMDTLVSGIYQRVLYEGMNLMTGFLQGLRGFWNVARNIRRVADAPGIGHLFGAFPNVPAAVISAGPSLDRSIPYLKKLCRRMLVIAVDGALKPLLGHGIRPHLVVAADENPGNVRKFSGLDSMQGTALAAVPSVNPDVFGNFHGPAFMSHIPLPAAMWLEWMGVRPGMLEGWGSVATLAFNLAVKSGADPIVFFGQDCAYSSWKVYARGQGVEETWASGLGRFATLEKKNLDTVLKSGLKSMPGVDGTPVPTALKMAAYRDHLLAMIGASGRTVMNAGGEGILFGPAVRQVEASALAGRFPLLADEPGLVIRRIFRSARSAAGEKVLPGLKKCAGAIDTIQQEIDAGTTPAGVSLRKAASHPVVELMLGAAVRLFLDGPLASGTVTEHHIKLFKRGLEDCREVVNNALDILEGGCPCIPAT